jgi:hypothetical protein
MAGLVKYYKQDRKVFVADSFEGLPEPYLPEDKDCKLHEANHVLGVSLDEVKTNFRRYELLDDNIVFIKGYFKDTMKNSNIEKLSILRLDGDMYGSTMEVLEGLYDKVSDGGFVIIDDYGLSWCKNAVDDFREKKGISDNMVQIGWTGAYWRKLQK